MQVNVKAGLTFASALRNILRTTPDILMVGEIRDQETAKIAIEAALTGHLVLSTLHTNDAPSALPRLIEMGVEPFLVSSAINCVMAQRLIRKLCPNCKVPYEHDPEILERMGFPMNENGEEMILYKPSDAGCSRCNNTGYKGRVGLYEVMPMSEEIQRLTVREASATIIMEQAKAGGHPHHEGRRVLQGQDGAVLPSKRSCGWWLSEGWRRAYLLISWSRMARTTTFLAMLLRMDESCRTASRQASSGLPSST